MSALLVDDLLVPAPSAGSSWRRVRGPQEPQLRLVPEPAVRPEAVVAAPLRLTERGLRVVVSFFLALFVTAAVVLVGAFFSVSDTPVDAPTAMALTQG